MIMKERMSRAITSWLPLSAVSTGIAMMAGSLLNLPIAKTITAAVASGAMTFSAFVMRSYSVIYRHVIIRMCLYGVPMAGTGSR